MRRPLAWAAWAVALLAGAAGSAHAATKLEGDYQLMMEARKNFRAFPWDFDSNDGGIGTPARLRVFSQPRTGTEAFVEVEADWRRGDDPHFRPEFQYRSAHLRFRREWQGRGLDTYLFSRQDRFWVNNHLIPFVQGRGDRQGIRVDSWGFLGLDASLVVADQSNELDPSNLLNEYNRRFGIPAPFAPLDSLNRAARLRTGDAYVLRLRREFLRDDRLRVGLTWNRYEPWAGRDSVSQRGPWISVLGFDSRLRLLGADVSLEYGQSSPAPTDLENPQLAFFKKPTPIRLSDRSVVQTEIRSLRVGTRRTGYLNVTPGWWMRGPAWQNALGGPNSDETGFIVQSYYLLPERAITYSNQLLWYGNKVNSLTKKREVYNELYIEFINGFTGKTSYRRSDEFTYVRRGRRLLEFRQSYYSWFNELQVESRLAWLRVQNKLLNIGRDDAKQLFVIENRINLTDRTKIYNRFSLANDPSVMRKGIFTQLQYRPTGNMEMFLQYGADDIGQGSNPVDDGNLAGSGNQSDVVKFIIKGNF